MARSAYVYVVFAPYAGDARVLAAFTVRHELVSFWRIFEYPEKEELTIYRLYDGGGDKRDNITGLIEKLAKEDVR